MNNIKDLKDVEKISFSVFFYNVFPITLRSCFNLPNSRKFAAQTNPVELSFFFIAEKHTPQYYVRCRKPWVNLIRKPRTLRWQRISQKGQNDL
jgi:hypothetical protein